MALRYKLRCTVTGHEKDVRSVCPAFFPEGGFVSGSRDITSRVWTPNESDGGFSEGHVMSGHGNYVFCVTMMPPDDTYTRGLIVTGSSDNSILAFTLDSPEPVYRLQDHADTVCALAAGKFGSLLSGSWDTTAKVWLNKKCVMTLQGHDSAVWAVALLPQTGLMLTASADKTIRMWKAGKCQHIFKGHDDCVRGLAVLSSSVFLSCANDATIRRWLVTGECTHTYDGHSSYIYSIAVLPNGEDFVSCGEDRSLRVWRDGVNQQTLTHPAQSVWAVCVLPNGDVVTGSSDGIIRVFTTSEDRAADEGCQKAFEEDVASSTIPAQIGDIKTEELVGPQALLYPGKRDGQTIMIRDGNKIHAHRWNDAESRWVKEGVVIGGTGSGKQLYQGKEYDHVFDVELTEGQPALKLPYNLSDDPWMAAHKFLDDNDLDQMFLDQVANFIQDQTKNVTLGVRAPSVSDPFTGGSRYIPASSGQAPDIIRDVPVHGADPFTGASSHRVAGTPPTVAADSLFPLNYYLKFDAANVAGILGKLREFNQAVSEDLRVDDSHVAGQEDLANGGTATPQALAALVKMLSWPPDIVFPAMDILRLSVRFEAANNHLFSSAGPGTLDLLLRSLSSESSAANKMLALRSLSNAFTHKAGETAVLANLTSLVAQLLNMKDTQPNKNIQIALSTVLLNLAVAFRKTDNEEGKIQIMSILAELSSVLTDSEARFRTLVGLGTLVSGSDTCLQFGKSLGLQKFVVDCAGSQHPKKVQECASQLIALG